MFWKKKRLYADAAAATPLAPEVKLRLIELLDIYGNPGALHEEGVAALHALDAARKDAAEAIEAHADEIVFTASGTEANNLALFGAFPNGYVGAHAITSVLEHPSVLLPLRRMEQNGLSVTYLGVNEDGLINLKELAEAITDKTALISIGMINSEIGAIQDIRGIAKVVRAERKKRALRQAQGEPLLSHQGEPLLFHVDAAQAPLWVRLRTEALGCDLMTLDAQKCMGPKGVGLLFVRRGTKLSAQTLGGGQERGMRSGTENVPLAGAFALALSLAQQSCEQNTAHTARVRDHLLREVTERVPHALVNGSLEHRVANNLNVSVPGLVGERAVIALSAYGIAASTRSACATKDEDLSHVLLALGTGPARAKEAIRFTLLPSVTESDARRIAQGLKKAANMYSNIDAHAA